MDFGLLTIAENQAFATTYTTYTERGSTRWMAPELFESGAKRTKASDAYAFGMTIFEVSLVTFPRVFVSSHFAVD